MTYCDQIADDWGLSSPKSHKKRTASNTTDEEGETLEIIFVDGSDRRTFRIGSTTLLKTIFDEYGEQCGMSLRSLRFTWNGNTVFLSSIKNKTPNEMKMSDKDEITVCNLSRPQGDIASQSNGHCTNCTVTPKKNKSKGSRKTSKGKAKKSHQGPAMIPADYKSNHSQLLSKLFEEAEPMFKTTRQRLNSIYLERQPKKKKKKHSSMACKTNVSLNLPSCVGGKAGKPYYDVHVGEVSNLYRTSKVKTQSCTAPVSTIDLHGCTTKEALHMLNENLEVWHNEAMSGDYPFVQQRRIVTGCGSQILAVTVEQWIRSNCNVSNAINKGRSRR